MVTASTTVPAANDTPDDVRALYGIWLENFLSFRGRTDFELRPLNLLSEDLVDPRHRANPWEHLAKREGISGPNPTAPRPSRRS